MSNRPLVIDLYCGLGGWAEGFLAEGYDVIGFDIEQRPYPGQLVLQDALTLHGSQFRHAAAIVASPPCQKYSYMAMPWKRAKALAAWYRESSERIGQLNALFDTCFRIQREASDAAGREIPLVVENVKGAQPWVGRARWHYGSFYLWGDVPALMPFSGRAFKTVGHANKRDGHSHTRHLTNQRESDAVKVPGMSWSGYGKPGYRPQGFNTTADQRLRDSRKNTGGSWFGQAHNTTSGHGNNPDGRIPAWQKEFGLPGEPDPHARPDGTKVSGDWFGTYADQKAAGTISPGRMHGKNSPARAQASAEIAKIPFPLAQHIASVFRPSTHNSISRLKQPPRSQTISTAAAGRTNP